ncbi:branched-chain amino acid ABC transporter ATP-binding protein/permease [Bradyrhizobium sp. Arg237L]|uniref:branched-chain amino acid ABC transporter ATP-binding protein/permease n=1 Tax=Bradyrhizobium sp. Arg237L TaxID=3003352 RepID=UPI00249DF3DB|nr:branched-chain amino acid ABC transporter ATP-binding protein/permease [Bradyrhizobium sp. Arg237L]MDI4237132.1 branched-chain amino acid ABC transporter ATP-binding protein/permease [Bradyrhizobium sp. Arg237L]
MPYCAKLRPALGLAGLGVLAAWPLVMASPYDLRLFTLAGVFAILAIGYQFIFGYVGELSLSQGAFFGFSAYVTGILAAKAGLDFAATFLASVVACVLLAVLISIPVLRLASHYFALATLGVGQVLLLLAIDWQSLTGGAIGLSGVPLPNLFGFQIGRGWPLLLFVWSFVLLAAAAAYQTKRGLYGLACHVVRQNAVAARSLAIDPDAIRFAMFLLSAAMAGVAGALHAHTIRIVSPEGLDFKVMISCLTMAVIGGRTHVWGAVAGALLVVHLPEWLRGFEQGYVIITSGVLIAILILAPEGLAGFVDRILPAAPPDQATAAVPSVPMLQKDRAAEGMLMPSETPILAIRGLTKTFGGVHALNGVSFSLMRGSITAVIGPNGSGKTTLVNCITGLYRADAGEIVLAGNEIVAMSSDEIAARGVGRTFQSLRLVDDMSVLDNVAVARFRSEQASLGRAFLTGRRDARLERARSHALHVLRQLGLDGIATAKCASLAHGTKRLVEIARAICLDPMVLLLDEPAAGLNESEQAELAGHLEALAARGLTLLIIEHNMEFLKSLATHMVCLDYGELIASGRPSAIYQDERVVEAYVGRRPAAEISA